MLNCFSTEEASAARRGQTRYSVLCTHYSLLTTYYSLLTTHYSLLTPYYFLLTTYYVLLTTTLKVLDLKVQHVMAGGARHRVSSSNRDNAWSTPAGKDIGAAAERDGEVHAAAVEKLEQLESENDRLLRTMREMQDKHEVELMGRQEDAAVQLVIT